MDMEEKLILRSIRQILQFDDHVRRQLCRGPVKGIQTQWEMYSAIRDQSRYLLDEIRGERQRARKRLLFEPYCMGSVAASRPSMAEAELENIIRIVTRIEMHKKKYIKEIEVMHNRGSLYEFYDRCSKQIAKLERDRGHKTR